MFVLFSSIAPSKKNYFLNMGGLRLRVYLSIDFHDLSFILAFGILGEAFQEASKKTQKFETYAHRFTSILAIPRGNRNRLNLNLMHVGDTLILAPQAALLRSGSRGRNLKRLWLPKRQFRGGESFYYFSHLFSFAIGLRTCPELANK